MTCIKKAPTMVIQGRQGPQSMRPALATHGPPFCLRELRQEVDKRRVHRGGDPLCAIWDIWAFPLMRWRAAGQTATATFCVVPVSHPWDVTHREGRVEAQTLGSPSLKIVARAGFSLLLWKHRDSWSLPSGSVHPLLCVQRPLFSPTSLSPHRRRGWPITRRTRLVSCPSTRPLDSKSQGTSSAHLGPDPTEFVLHEIYCTFYIV